MNDDSEIFPEPDKTLEKQDKLLEVRRRPMKQTTSLGFFCFLSLNFIVGTEHKLRKAVSKGCVVSGDCVPCAKSELVTFEVNA
jgi:hypothetical protein